MPGFHYLGQCKTDAQWGMFREDAPLEQRRLIPPPSGNGHKTNTDSLVKHFGRGLTPERRRQLAMTLGLPESALSALTIGYIPSGPHGDPAEPCWTIAEADGRGRIIGFTCRYAAGQKKAYRGLSRSLALPAGWAERDGPIFLPEGSSDTLTLTALGLAAIGRPSCRGGIDLLADLPSDRRIIVVAEYDQKPDGTWPGRDGAVETARKLAERLGRPVDWVLPPNRAKDVREWALSRKLDRECADAWHDAGEELLREWQDAYQSTDDPPHPGAAPNRHQTIDQSAEPGIIFSSVQAQRVNWLWPARIPLGKLTILDGDPGLGKSVLTLDLAARVSRGLPMPDDELGVKREPAGVVLLSAEDGLEDTIVPRLDGAGADRSRILALQTVSDKHGKDRLLSFPLDADYVRAAVQRIGAVLVVVDPLTAYLGAEINSHRDADCRRALWPVSQLAEDTGAAVLVVRHLNKGTGANALYRGGGSIGIIGAARSGLLVARDPDNEDRRVLASTKCNLAKLPASLGFALNKGTGDMLRIGWTGISAHTAETLLAAPRDDEGRGALAEAMEVLRTILSNGERPVKEIKNEARKAGVSETTLQRAKSALGARSRHDVGFGPDGQWYWFLPSNDGNESRDSQTPALVGCET